MSGRCKTGGSEQANIVRMALAIMVSTRLWLGGVVSPHRDLDLIQVLANKIRNLALCRPLLLAVDGLASYVTTFRKAFRTALPRRKGELGRPQLISWPNIAIVQVVKQRVDGQWNISRRIVQGSEAMVKALIQKTQGAGVINTAFIERFNATFRQRLNCLARRTRTLARKAQTLEAGMYVVGCLYNFCHPHHSLRLKLSVGRFGHCWVHRTPAIAAGLADHLWTPTELFNFKVPLPRWQPDRKSTRLNSSHVYISYSIFFFNDTATTEIYTLSLHDALPICYRGRFGRSFVDPDRIVQFQSASASLATRSEEHTSELQSRLHLLFHLFF